MDLDRQERNSDIKKATRTAFLFILFTMGVSQILGAVLPLPSDLCNCIGMLLGTLVALRGPSGPEKGTLMEDRQKMTGTRFVVLLGAFMAGKLLCLGPSALLLQLFAAGKDPEALQNLVPAEGNLLTSFLFMGIVTPFCEEAVFRGCVGRTYKKYGIWFGLLMSSLLFAMYHGNLFQLVSTFLPGVVLFYVAMNYGIKWSMLLHFINNGVLVSGKSLLDQFFPGAFLVNYGEYILEAALIVAALLLMKKENSVERVKDFLRAPENEKGVYRAAMGNVWFVLMILFLLLMTAMVLAMMNGSLTAVPAAA